MSIAPNPPDCPECIEQPGVPPVAGRPGQVLVTPDFGWDAGANSIDTVSGDAILSFSSVPIIGCVVGLRTQRALIGSFPSYLHAILLQSVAGVDVYCVLEAGVIVTSLVARALDSTDENGNACDDFDIIRQSGNVVYQINGVPFYSSKALSLAPLVTSACLYYPGDTLA